MGLFLPKGTQDVSFLALIDSKQIEIYTCNAHQIHALLEVGVASAQHQRVVCTNKISYYYYRSRLVSYFLLKLSLDLRIACVSDKSKAPP